ncbi:hypothetical protein SAMN05216262_11151 [Colwellia chukchiensis]|uniref:VOC domain-containing protein n=1 Tax=Colwellia chukchiensis TaxID=641665 RepID=A0A1H7QBU8_9GAMM|nr:VOC family protein [Colwellia chukchiensis]SEL45443.1 hypothetical protein SAMN05216262_11151 [Colwellia chukchiensis]
MENQIVWVDIPVTDLPRAMTFYSAVLNAEVKQEEFEHFTIGLLPHAQTNVSGCLVPSPAEQIFTSGPLIYFNVNGRLDDAIKKCEMHGGRLVEEKMSIGGHGFRAIIHDSEGNRIALHSNTL